MKTVKEFGQLDIVCNIAGISHAEDWRKVLDINLVSLHHFMCSINYIHSVYVTRFAKTSLTAGEHNCSYSAFLSVKLIFVDFLFRSK